MRTIEHRRTPGRILNMLLFTNLGLHFPRIPSVHGGTEAGLARALTVGKETLKITLIYPFNPCRF